MSATVEAVANLLLLGLRKKHPPFQSTRKTTPQNVIINFSFNSGKVESFANQRSN